MAQHQRAAIYRLVAQASIPGDPDMNGAFTVGKKELTGDLLIGERQDNLDTRSETKVF